MTFKKYLKTNFIVVNGDILTSVNFSDLLDFHLKNKATATMTVKTHEIQHPYGVVNTEGMEIKNLQEISKTKVNRLSCRTYSLFYNNFSHEKLDNLFFENINLISKFFKNYSIDLIFGVTKYFIKI